MALPCGRRGQEASKFSRVPVGLRPGWLDLCALGAEAETQEKRVTCTRSPPEGQGQWRGDTWPTVPRGAHCRGSADNRKAGRV